MGKFYSIALHDLRISEGQGTILIIEGLLKHFQVPLTIHLIFDADLATQPGLLTYLQEHIHTNNLEIVFHGLKHSCSRNVSKFLLFFHKYQAEYLENDERHMEATEESYRGIVEMLNTRIGICPPCWLATRKNMIFFRSLHPLYIETLLYLRHQDHKVISPVISIGSPKRFEIFFLKILAWTICSFSALFLMNHIRIAVHPCDLDSDPVLSFFENMAFKLNRRGFKPVLLRELH